MTTETTGNLVYAYLEPRKGHPRFGEIRYVGSSTYGTLRPRDFRGHAHGLVGNWLKACGESVPEIVILCEFAEKLPHDDLLLEETKYITFYRELGCADKNLQEAGRGGRHSQETKTKIAAKLKGKKRTDATKAKISAAQTKYLSDLANREKLSKARTKYLSDPANCEKISAGVTKFYADPVNSGKASLATKAGWVTRRANMAKATYHRPRRNIP